MSEIQERNDSEYAKWIAGQSFESLADIMPLDDMTTSDEDASRGINAGRWMRACAVILQDDNDQLYAKFKDDKAAEFWLDFAEDLQKFIDSEKAGIEIFEACHMRLLVCAHRYQEENFPEGSQAKELWDNVPKSEGITQGQGWPSSTTISEWTIPSLSR